MASRQDSTNRCHRCIDGSITTDAESGEVFCSRCGLVIVERAESYAAEKQTRVSDSKNDSSRIGPPTSSIMYDGGLSTVIGRADRDASGRVITSLMKSNIKRLRTLDGRSPVDRRTAGSLKHGLMEIKRLKDKLAVSDAVMERAAHLFRKAVEINMTRGRSLGGLAASIMYVACRETDTVRDLNDIERASNVKRRDITRIYRMIVIEMGLSMPVTDPARCVSKIAGALEVSEKTIRKAIDILQNAKKNGRPAGKSPIVLAAAALYMAGMESDNPKTQFEVSNASGVSGVSVRNVAIFLKKLQCPPPDKAVP